MKKIIIFIAYILFIIIVPSQVQASSQSTSCVDTNTSYSISLNENDSGNNSGILMNIGTIKDGTYTLSGSGKTYNSGGAGFAGIIVDSLANLTYAQAESRLISLYGASYTSENDSTYKFYYNDNDANIILILKRNGYNDSIFTIPSTSINSIGTKYIYLILGQSSISGNLIVETIKNICTTTSNYPYPYPYSTSYNTSYTSPLEVSCYSNPSSGNVGDNIRWMASPYGGNGNYYITWSGTDGLSGSGTSIYKSYYNSGSKYASVTVISDGQTITKSCGNTVEIYNYNNNYYNNYNSPLYISCRPNVIFAPVETTVVWNAYASGGNGYYTYRWNGSDYLQGYNSSLAVVYHSPGPKTASITITSGNQTITQVCLNNVTIGVPTQAYYNNTYTPPPVVKYITKKTVPPKTETVVKTESKPIVENKSAVTQDSALSAASLFSLRNVPWGWVAVLVILVLFATVLYLIFNRNKI